MTTKLSLGIIPFSGGRVDHQKRKIYGANAMAVGEAQGHRLWADTKTLSQMADLANARQYPIMMRFGHPGMSENAFGKKLATATNFRVEGNKLVHDIHFSEWASLSPSFAQDPVAYIMKRAESDPRSFGESVVVDTEKFWLLDDGSELAVHETDESPENKVYDYPVMRPTQFHFVDFVGDGALTPDGIFSQDALMWKDILNDTSSDYAMQAFAFLKGFQERFNLSAPEMHLKVNQLMGKYTLWESFQMPNELEQVTPVQAETGDENPAVPVPEADPIADAMAEAAELAVATAEPIEADSPLSEAPVDLSQYVARAEYDALQAQVVQLQQALQHQSVQLADYLKHINLAVGNLNQRMDDFNQEDLVTGTVGNSPFTGASQFSLPQPAGTIPVPVAMAEKHADNIAQAQQGTTEPVVVSGDKFLEGMTAYAGFSSQQ